MDDPISTPPDLVGRGPRVSVVVPNWNGERLLPDLLAALERQSWRGFETIVVDNGSRDRSLAILRGRSDVRLVEMGRNTGFAAAANAGIAAAQAGWVLLLNNDMTPEPDFLAALMAAVEAQPEAGSLACKVVFRDAPLTIDSAGDRLAPSGRATGIGRGQPDGPRFALSRWVFGATGGAALYRRERVAEAGGFDQDFFLYVEDTDLALRLQLLGARCLYVPAAVARHVGSASMKGREDERSRYCLRNHLFFLIKSYPAALLVRHAGAVAAGVVREVGFAFAATRARAGALRAAWCVGATLAAAAAGAPRMLARRLRVKRRVPLADIEALLG